MEPRSPKVALTAGEALIEQGRQQGFREGLLQGMRQVVRGWLRQRFDLEVLPPEFDHRIGEAGEPQLEGWVDRLVGASRLEDVFA